MRCAMSSASTTRAVDRDDVVARLAARPPRPACRAAPGRRRRRLPAADMNRTAKRTTAKTRFVAGPGEDDGDALPGALPPVRVRRRGRRAISATPRSAPSGGWSPAERVSQLARAASARAASSSPACERPLRARSTGPTSSGRLAQRAAEVHVDVARRGPVHPRDLHVAAERDRADAVLDPLRFIFTSAGGKPM